MNRLALFRNDTIPILTQEMYPNLSLTILGYINEFLYSKASEYSKSHMYSYVLFLPKFFSDLNINSISDVSSELIADWLLTYKIGKAKQTIATKVAMLSCFFNYLVDENIIMKNPILRSFRCKVSSNTVRSLDEIEYQKVKRQAEKMNLFDRTLFEVFDSSGIRCSELIFLKVENVDLGNKKITVTGKGNKTRVGYVSELSVYLLEKLMSGKNVNEYIFSLKGGNPIHRSTALYKINSLGKKAELTISLFPHRLRHCFASRLYYEGLNLKKIRDLLGHKDERTTMRYIDSVPLDIRYYYDKVMSEK